eukprot:gb/GECH01000249.1/.p1 GENE.gb/GECH01000249.1/~~gb/GECH01000249.1/.p1  ORF type:complete len:256 (+),score=58.04 gb/GECH01000249.1/:1-768(+)
MLHMAIVKHFAPEGYIHNNMLKFQYFSIRDVLPVFTAIYAESFEKNLEQFQIEECVANPIIVAYLAEIYQVSKLQKKAETWIEEGLNTDTVIPFWATSIQIRSNRFQTWVENWAAEHFADLPLFSLPLDLFTSVLSKENLKARDENQVAEYALAYCHVLTDVSQKVLPLIRWSTLSPCLKERIDEMAGVSGREWKDRGIRESMTSKFVQKQTRTKENGLVWKNTTIHVAPNDSNQKKKKKKNPFQSDFKVDLKRK